MNTPLAPILGWGPDILKVCNPVTGFSKLQNKKRVLMLGDSVINCTTEEDAKNKLPYLVADELESSYDVVNISAGGWGTDQEYLAYYNFGKHYAPDVVLLFFNPSNDLFNNISSTAIGAKFSKPRFVLSPQGELGLERNWNPERSLGGWDKVLASTQIGLRYLLYQRGRLDQNQDPFENETYSHLFSYRVPPPKSLVDSWRLTQKILMRFKKKAQENGSSLAIVYVPGGISTAHTKCQPIKCEGYGNKKIETSCFDQKLTLDIYQPFHWMKKFTEENGILLIHNIDEVKKYSSQHTDVAYDCFHLSHKGNELLSKKVTAFLSSLRGLQRSPRQSH